MTTDLRTELRDRIAARMSDWLGEMGVGEPFPEDDLADAVMELFPDVEIEEVVPFRGASVHTCYVLWTAPEPMDGDDG